MKSIKLSGMAITALAVLGMVAVGCPRPPGAVLSLVVTSSLSETSPVTKGDGTCTEIDDDDISALNITIEEIQLERMGEGGTSVLTVFEGPAVVSLMNEAEISELLRTVRVPVGTYVSATLFVSNVQVAITSAPTTFVNVDVPNNGAFSMPITLMTDGGGQTLVVFELGNAICQLVGGGLELNADFDVEFATELEEVHAEGQVDDDPFTQNRLELETADFEITVDFSTVAGIFLPTDNATPTGTVADLVPGAQIRVIGTMTTNWMLLADQIEILRFDDA